MSELDRLLQWRRDLHSLLIEQEMQEDDVALKNLALIDLELDGAKVNLPHTNEEVKALLLEAHKAKVIDLTLATLHHALGYYFLPERRLGENEPPIGSSLGDELKRAMERDQVDLYAVKEALIGLLQSQAQTKIKTVVFDLDGTLLDTLQSLANCYNRVLSAHGLKAHAAERYQYFIGNGAKQCLLSCLQASGELTRQSDEDIERLLLAQREDYINTWQQDVAVYDGIRTLLDTLIQEGLTLAVLTNKDHDFAQSCVEHFFPDEPFAIIQGHETAVPHKPDATGIKLIAQKSDSLPEEMVMIGDTSVDIATAKAAGLASIGVLWGFRQRDELEQAGADYIVSKPGEITSLLLGETKLAL